MKFLRALLTASAVTLCSVAFGIGLNGDEITAQIGPFYNAGDWSESATAVVSSGLEFSLLDFVNIDVDDSGYTYTSPFDPSYGDFQITLSGLNAGADII